MASTHKRVLSTADPQLETETKKIKTYSPTSDPESAEQAPQSPPSHTNPIFLSSLRCDRYPTPHGADGEEPEVYGEYNNAGSKGMKMAPNGWSSEHKAYIYTPSSKYQFEYTRLAYSGALGPSYTEYGGIWGEPTPDPLFFLHQTPYFDPKFQPRDEAPEEEEEEQYGGSKSDDEEDEEEGDEIENEAQKDVLDPPFRLWTVDQEPHPTESFRLSCAAIDMRKPAHA